MEITVVCYVSLRDALGGERTKRVHLDPPADVDALVAALGIATKNVFQILVNEEQAPRSQELSEGDTVTLMPPFTGG